jgi:hypothetical protein
MSAQPANTDIKVYRTIRAQRQPLLFDSVAALIKRLRPLVMSIPGHEIRVGVVSRDTTTADFSPYMGEARHNATRGFPIVIGLNKQVSFATAQTQLPDVDFAFQIGQDRFIKNTIVGLDGDLHADARNLTADQP